MTSFVKKIKWLLFYKLPWRLQGYIFKLVTFSVSFPYQFKKKQVGTSSYVDPSVQVIGWKNVSIGRDSLVSEQTWLNVNYRDNSTPRIIIGNNCHIGRRNFFSSGPLIHIKDYGFTGLDCQFLGCGHNIETPLIPYLASGLSTGGVIEIGINCWLATSVTVLQNVRIGHGTIIGARSLVTHDIPPFSIAIGNPCKVIKRYDFKNNCWILVENWTEELEALLPTEEQYLVHLTVNNKKIQPSLIAGSSRFGWL